MVLSDQQFRDHVEELRDGRWKCNFCGHLFAPSTSISRIKWHFSGVKGRGVAICGQVPRDVQEAAYLATDGANKKPKGVPSSSNNEVCNATSTCPQEHNNESANLTGEDATRMLMEHLDAQAEVGEGQTEAGNHIENLTRETSQPIQRSVAPERLPVEEQGTTADLVGLATSRSWGEMQALLMTDSGLINETNTTISASFQTETDENAEADPLAALQSLYGKFMSDWESRLLEIRAMLDDAEQAEMTGQAMKIWLDKLRDLAYDVKDILDEYETEVLTSKLKGAAAASQASTSTVQPSASMLNGPKLQVIAARWEDIMKEKNDKGFVINVVGRSNKENRRVQTTSLVKETKMYGRKNAKEDLVHLLMKDEPSNSRYSVIPIVGMGGIGKTTLAQFVYNDERLKFDYKACPSDDFDITRLTKSMLKGSFNAIDDLNELQEKLKTKLYGKKFFIVRDDVWPHNYEDWTTLCGPFASAAPGSKIIFTTRDKNVALRIGSVDAYMLKELPCDECQCLFAQHALDAENFEAHPDLKEVGEKIVQRCKGLPLAAKALGGLLRHKQDLEDWEDILNSDIWDLSKEESGVLSALRLSYFYLPSHLKRCFRYCAIFPKDYLFDENELVLRWMAEGFVEKTKRKKQEKDLGHKYFKELLSRSLFQQCSDNKSLYIMHDLIVDLARWVSGEICYLLDDMKSSGATSCAKARHLSFTSHKFDTSQRFKACCEMESLRSFLTIPKSSDEWNHLSTKVLDDLIPKLKCLRTLSLANYGIRELPESIGALKLLRYLNLSRTSIVRLPVSLGNILNLQTLIMRGCRLLVGLPVSIGDLLNLQHLDVRGTDLLKEMSHEISKLKNLHFLPKFIVGEGSGLGIRELMRLPRLQEELRITGLQNVSNIQDAKLANLRDMSCLRELALEWSNKFHDARDESREKQVLTTLQPHKSLEKLSIISYGGIELPSWVGNPSFSRMVDLELSGCRKITSLPPLGKLIALKHLSIKKMDNLREMAVDVSEEPGGMFPKLLELRLEYCPMLIGKFPRCLPSLKKLHISSCGQLANLPEMLPSLCELEVGDCHVVIFQMVPDFTSLSRFEIWRISGLVSLAETLVKALVAVEDLVIEKCYDLKYLWQDGVDVDKLANLKQLRISGCEQLQSLVEGEEGLLPPNLQVLSLGKCNNMEKLANGLHCLTSLRELEIWRCNKLVSFAEGAGLPYTLKSLEIRDCDSLESLPNGILTMMNGNNSLLEEFEIYDCRSLISFPKGKLPTTLKKLRIYDVENIESETWLLEKIMQCDAHLEDLSLQSFSIASIPAGEFPTSLKTLRIYSCKKIKSLPSLRNLSRLTQLKIEYCDELESFLDEELPLPNLISLHISSFHKLRYLPNHMDSLQRLRIYNCSSLESFPEVIRCRNLRQPITKWGLHTLTSLKHLEIDFMSPYYKTEVDYFPGEDGLPLPTSLTSLTLRRHKNLKSISRGIQHLTFLKSLIIMDCPKLHVLPKEGFSPIALS